MPVAIKEPVVEAQPQVLEKVPDIPTPKRPIAFEIPLDTVRSTSKIVLPKLDLQRPKMATNSTESHIEKLLAGVSLKKASHL